MIWNSKPAPSTIPGQRIYAIGDVHGRLDLLDQLLGMIQTDDAEREQAERRTLIFLGDYIDRGADSRGVIETLISGMPEGFECIHLKGNHEEMLLQALDDPLNLSFWMGNGGIETLKSYGVFIASDGMPARPKALARALAAALPNDHLTFLRQLGLCVAFGDYFFVHAGVQPGVPLMQQREEDCLYIREPFLSHRGSFGKIIVHGHTPVPAPQIKANRIGIDTGGFFSGHLTALRLEGESRAFLAT